MVKLSKEEEKILLCIYNKDNNPNYKIDTKSLITEDNKNEINSNLVWLI